MFGGLDICINCAGFVNKSLVYDDKSDGTSTWRRAVNVNLVAVIDGTRIAVSLSINCLLYQKCSNTQWSVLLLFVPFVESIYIFNFS